MTRETERMHLVKENFMMLHQQGFSVPEIATMFRVHRTTVYGALQEIANVNGVRRDSLLKIIKTAPEKSDTNSTKLHQIEKVDEKKLLDVISSTIKDLDILINTIETTIMEENENDSINS